MVQLVAVLQVGDSSVTGWVVDVDGRVQAQQVRPLPTLRPETGRLELDPAVWESACREALAGAVAQAPAGDWLGVTVTAPGGGFLLLDSAGSPVGNGILRGDRRGADFVQALEDRHALTGRQASAELTLPKLLAVRAEEPARWERVARVLFLHDWVVARMTGVHATEASYACSGGMADVGRRGWAEDLLQDNGIRPSQLAPVVQAGTVVGELLEGWGAPATLPVVAGCAETQLRAMGAGGLRDGVVTVVAGAATRVQLATADPAPALQAAASVSTHAAGDLWAVEACLSAGGDPLVIRAQVQELEAAAGQEAEAVVVCGEGAADGRLPAALADVLGRDVHHAGRLVITVAAAVLVARAVGAHAHVPRLPSTALSPS